MLTIHHLGISQSERIVWLCEELGLEYVLHRYDRMPNGAAPPEYKALHPLGTAPIVMDGDLVLAETGAIVEYIVRRHGGGRLMLGPEHPAFNDYVFWAHYPGGSLAPAFMMEAVAQRLGSAPLSGRGDIGLGMVEARLGEAEWLAGDEFTIADIMVVYPLSRAQEVSGRDMSAYPNILAYLERIRARPAHRAAMAKAEPA